MQTLHWFTHVKAEIAAYICKGAHLPLSQRSLVSTTAIILENCPATIQYTRHMDTFNALRKEEFCIDKTLRRSGVEIEE